MFLNVIYPYPYFFRKAQQLRDASASTHAEHEKPRLRTWNVPVKHVETRLISSLSRGLVPFNSVPPVFVFALRFP